MVPLHIVEDSYLIAVTSRRPIQATIPHSLTQSDLETMGGFVLARRHTLEEIEAKSKHKPEQIKQENKQKQNQIDDVMLSQRRTTKQNQTKPKLELVTSETSSLNKTQQARSNFQVDQIKHAIQPLNGSPPATQAMLTWSIPASRRVHQTMEEGTHADARVAPRTRTKSHAMQKD